MVVDRDEVLLVVSVAVAGEQDAVLVAAPAVAAVVPRSSSFRLSIRLWVVVVVAVAEEEQQQEQGVVVVVVANSILCFAGVKLIRCFAAAVPLLPLLPRSDSELVLPHSVRPMHLMMLHPQV